MKLSVDISAGALHLKLDDSVIVDSEEVAPGIVLDYNEANEVVGLEMQNLADRSSSVNLEEVKIETIEAN